VLIVALLGLPLLIVIELPRFLDLAGSVPPPTGGVSFATPEPAFKLLDATPTPSKSRFAPLDDSVPPTLAPPVATATAAPTPQPTPTGERIVIGNTGGLGAVLRADPVTGRPVGTLREQQVLDVTERRNIPGSGDWVRVRTADGLEGWVTGIVARPIPTPRPSN
jgi:SH3 domain-containing protein